MHAALGNHLSVEVSELLQEPDVLEQHRTAFPGGHNVLVVDDGSAVSGGELLFFFHNNLLSCSVLQNQRSPEFDPARQGEISCKVPQ
jgi:hypothetical protein